MEDSLDIEALRASVADVLDAECGTEAVLHHCNSSSGPWPALWNTAVELGWTALGVSEDFGGLGLGISALVPIYEELGRVAAPLPFFPTMLAADCIERSGSEEQKSEWLSRISAGEMATIEAPRVTDTSRLAFSVTGDELILEGASDLLLDARDAGLIIVLARGNDGEDRRIVLETADGFDVETQILWDHGHTISRIHASALRLPVSRALATDQQCESALLTHASLALAAEAIGGSQGVLALTVEYMKTREQFGKPIGSFQALKHRVADHRTRTVAGRSLLNAATLGATQSGLDAQSEASCAKALCCSGYEEIARDCIQLHGGMGFTAEQACHLYLKRAALISQLFGDHAFHELRATKSFREMEAAR